MFRLLPEISDAFRLISPIRQADPDCLPLYLQHKFSDMLNTIVLINQKTLQEISFCSHMLLKNFPSLPQPVPSTAGTSYNLKITGIVLLPGFQVRSIQLVLKLQSCIIHKKSHLPCMKFGVLYPLLLPLPLHNFAYTASPCALMDVRRRYHGAKILFSLLAHPVQAAYYNMLLNLFLQIKARLLSHIPQGAVIPAGIFS